MTEPAPARPRRRPRRRWGRFLAIALGLIVIVVAALPWLISLPFAQHQIKSRINAAVAPGRLDIGNVAVSWLGPTRLYRVALVDPAGARVADIPVAVLDLTLGQLILGNVSPASLTLDHARLDIHRGGDGKVDLVEALQAVLATKDPHRDLTVRIDAGSLTFHDPALETPVEAETLALDLAIPPRPHPITWSVKLGRDAATSSIEVDGDFDHWLSRSGKRPPVPDLRIEVVARRWPIRARVGPLGVVAGLDGTIELARNRGYWQTSSPDARLVGLQVHGDPLRGDTLALDRLEASWALNQGGEGWSIDRLGLTSSLGELRADGKIGNDQKGRQRIEGRLDLAAIARQLPHALRLRDGLSLDKGSARLTIDAEGVGDRATYQVEARLADLVATDRPRDRTLTLRDPASFNARLVRQAGGSRVEQFTLKTGFLDASAEGQFEDGVSLGGTLDLAAFRQQLADWVDLGPIDLAGRVALTGSIRSHEGTFRNDLKATIRDLKVAGVGTSTIRRDLCVLETQIDGPADASGMPTSWGNVHLKADSGDMHLGVGLTANDQDGSILWSARASTLLIFNERSRLAWTTYSGTWSPGRAPNLYPFKVDGQIDAGLGHPAADGVRLVAAGLLDLGKGELTISTSPGSVVQSTGIRVAGISKAGSAWSLDAALSGELAPLDRFVSAWAGREPIGLEGGWSSTWTTRGDEDGQGWDLAGKLGIDRPSESSQVAGRPTSLAVRAHYGKASDRLDLAEITLSTAYGTIDASGRLESPGDRPKVDLVGRLNPDFAAINAVLASKVEPGAKLDGAGRAFRVSGRLGDGGDWKGLDAELGFDLAGLDVFGMKVGPGPVVLRGQGERWTFDPISTTLNEGHVRLEPELDLEARGGPMLRLAKNSTIRDARINDEVSRRVLAFVAPVLDRATRVRGRVTVDLDHAEIPIGPGRARQAKVEGAVVFSDVEFAPGPLASDILAAAGRRDTSIKLDQPVTLTVADGRINQSGLSIPVGNLTRIDLAGWVGFDRSIALTASFPVTPAMLGNNEVLADIAAGTRVKVPITGTLGQPRVDRDALNAGLRDMGGSLLIRGATRGLLELLKPRQGQGPDAAPAPANPPAPRPTPEERKEIRQQRKQGRRERPGQADPTPPPPPADPR